MERADKSKPLWIKKTRGTLTITNPRLMRLKHRQKFRATPEELGRWIEQFDLLEGKVDMKKYPEQINKEPPPPEKYQVVSAGPGWYNVTSPTGEVVNEKMLRENDAKELVEQLEDTKSE